VFFVNRAWSPGEIVATGEFHGVNMEHGEIQLAVSLSVIRY